MNIKFNTVIFALLISCNAISQPRERPKNWATPIINTKLNNFYKISEKLYRSEQPNDEAFVELETMGITSVLNLRKHHSDRNDVQKTQVKINHLRLSARNMTQKQVYDALKIINEAKDPLLIHCWHGSDRTGTVAAAYRMVFQNWSKAQAIDEFKNGGYGYHQWAFPNLIELLESLDVDNLKYKLGLTTEIN